MLGLIIPLAIIYIGIALQWPIVAKVIALSVVAYFVVWIGCWLWCLRNADFEGKDNNRG